METKKSIVRSAIFQKSFIGKSGEAFIFEILMDNGDKGQYFSSSKEQSTFKEGTEIDYTYEKKINGEYTNYYIKPVKSNGFQAKVGNPQFEHKRTALRCAVELCAAGKIELGKIGDYSNSFMKFLNE